MSNPNVTQRVVVIDLGSNTARLIVLQAVPGHAWRLEDEIREVVRLRQGMTDDGLSAEAMERAFAALRLFKRFADAVRADEGLEHIAFLATCEPVQGLGVLADVVVHPHEDLGALDAERTARGRGGRHPVAHAPDLDGDVGAGAIEERSSQ